MYPSDRILFVPVVRCATTAVHVGCSLLPTVCCLLVVGAAEAEEQEQEGEAGKLLLGVGEREQQA